MKNNVNTALVRIGIIFLILIFVSSAGCIKYLPTNNGGDKGKQTISSDAPLTNTISPSGNISFSQSPAISSPVVVTTPPGYIEVNEVDPEPYITPDPYKLPYRDHGNWTTGEPVRIPKIPQFTQNIILCENLTAFRVNVTKGPLVVDLTYSPKFSNPDQTKKGSESSGVSVNSFVFSNAEVAVIDEISGATIAKEGYGGVYSSDLEKKITIYREGPFIITLKGNFIDVNMAIITGSALEPVTPAPTSEYDDWEED